MPFVLEGRERLAGGDARNEQNPRMENRDSGTTRGVLEGREKGRCYLGSRRPKRGFLASLQDALLVTRVVIRASGGSGCCAACTARLTAFVLPGRGITSNTH